MVHLLETLVWSKSKDATKKIPQHKPVLFMPDFMVGLADEGIRKDTVAADVDTIKEILARPRG